ncbi:MAG TPA: Rieske (2Fe-2S) protein [Candidatus Kapabacteria bacterium]|nr:Rieske (2Fe-2S) protein [Candidatus Kapabacteria bacterium]HPO62828.1 Rieske (2Fe-2S) protein [Candidatus Kapabacteria bacterium]
MNQSRRDFLKDNIRLLGIGSGALLFGLSSCEEFMQKQPTSSGVTKEFCIDDEDEINKTRLNRIGWGILKYFGKLNYGIPVIVVRIDINTFVSFSAMCTHEHCIMRNYTTELPTGKGKIFQEIKCNCHGSSFDAYNNGKIVTGPAEKPLKQFPTSFNPETNIISIEF